MCSDRHTFLILISALVSITSRSLTIQAVVDSGVTPRIVSLLAHEDVSVVTAAMRVIGNLISGDDRQTQAAIDAGALPGIVPLLTHPKRSLRREACWAVSNVAAGTRAQIAAVIAAPGMLEGVVANLRSGEWNVKKEAAWSVCNIATLGAPEHVARMVAADVTGPLVDCLNTSDARMLCVVLDAVTALLAMDAQLGGALAAPGNAPLSEQFEAAGLLSALEAGQEHADEEVYAKCVAIIERYYGVDDDGGSENTMREPGHTAHSASVTGSTFGKNVTNVVGSTSHANFGSTLNSTCGPASMMMAPSQLFASPSVASAAPNFSFTFV